MSSHTFENSHVQESKIKSDIPTQQQQQQHQDKDDELRSQKVQEQQKMRSNIKVSLICDFVNHFHGVKTAPINGKPVEDQCANLNNLFTQHIYTLCPLDLEYSLLNPECDGLVGELFMKLLAKKEKVKLNPKSGSFYTDWNEMLMQKVAKMYKSFLRIKDKLFKQFGFRVVKVNNSDIQFQQQKQKENGSKFFHANQVYQIISPSNNITWEYVKSNYIMPKKNNKFRKLDQTSTKIMADLSLQNLSLLRFFESSFGGGNPFIDQNRSGDNTLIKVQGPKPGVWIMRQNYKKFHELSIDQRIEILYYFCMKKLETPEELNCLTCQDSQKDFIQVLCVQKSGIELFRYSNHSDARIYKLLNPNKSDPGSIQCFFTSISQIQEFIQSTKSTPEVNSYPKLHKKLNEIFEWLKYQTRQGERQFSQRQHKIRNESRIQKVGASSKFYNILPFQEIRDQKMKLEKETAQKRMKRAIIQVSKQTTSQLYGSLGHKKSSVRKRVDRQQRLKQRQQRAELVKQGGSFAGMPRRVGRPSKGGNSSRPYKTKYGSYDGSDEDEEDQASNDDITLQGRFQAKNQCEASIQGDWYHTNEKGSNREEFQYKFIPPPNRAISKEFRLENANIAELFSGRYQGEIEFNDEKITDVMDLVFKQYSEEDEAEEQGLRFKVEGRGHNSIGNFEIRGQMLYFGEGLQFDCKKYYDNQSMNSPSKRYKQSMMPPTYKGGQFGFQTTGRVG